MPAPTAPALSAALLRLPDRSPLPALTPERYALAHAAFEDRSTQRSVIADWLTTRLRRRSGHTAVLSVGCGDGRLDAEVAARVSARRTEPLQVDGLDPHPPSAVQFLSRVGAVPGVDAGAWIGTADTFVARRSYDVVVAVHSLYYAVDLPSVLNRLRAALRPAGELVLLLAPLGELNSVAGALAPDTGGHRQWWSHDLADALSEVGMTAERTTLRGVLRLDDCLDPVNETGRAILDFTAQAVLPEALRMPVLDHLLSVRLPGQGLALDHPVDAWVVSA